MRIRSERLALSLRVFVVISALWHAPHANAQGGTAILHEYTGLYNARLHGSPSGATLTAALSAPASVNKMVYLAPGTWTLEADVNFTGGRGLWMARGATMNKNGFNITLNSCPRLDQDPPW